MTFVPKVIEASGSTSLIEVGTNFYLDITARVWPRAEICGAAVVAGQFGGWTPIGAEQTATGYEVAWKVAGADQYRSGIPTATATTISNIRWGCFGNQHGAGIA